MRPICDIRRFKDLLQVRLGLNTHILLSEGLCLLLEVGVLLRVAISNSFQVNNADISIMFAACALELRPYSDDYLPTAPKEVPS